MVLPWCHIKEHCSYYHGNPDIDPKRHDTTMARVQKKNTSQYHGTFATFCRYIYCPELLICRLYGALGQ